ncbi:MAG: MFS transporter [Planctomycetes bacterium]|nr:MFS transporter [Planctomycetota bacterium]
MTRLARSIVLNLPVSFVAMIAWFGVYTLVNAYVTRGLHGSDDRWATLSLCLSVGMVVSLLVCTEIILLLGKRNTVTLSIVLAAAAFVAIAFTENFVVIGGALAVMGFTQAALATAYLSLLTHAAGDRPGRALGIYQWTVTVVTILILPPCGYLAEQGWYRMMFLLIAVVCAGCAAAFHFTAKSMGHQETEVVSIWRLSRRDLSELLHGPYVRVLLLGICGEPWYYHMVNQLFRNHAHDAFGLGEDTISQVVALGRIPSLISLFVVAHFIDRLNITRFYGIALAVSAVAAALITAMPASGLMIGAYFLYYAVHGTVWGSNSAAVNAQIAPRLRESAFTLMSLAQSGAMIVVGVTQQRMLAYGMTFPSIYAVCAAVAVLCGVALAVTSRRRAEPVLAVG